MKYKVGDKAFIEVEIVNAGDGISYCFPNTKGTVYDCRVNTLNKVDSRRMYVSDINLIPTPFAKIKEELNKK